MRVRAAPGAKRSGVAGVHGEALRIKIAAPPVDGKANKELIRYLATVLGVAKRDVELVRGRSGRDKVLRVHGVEPDLARSRLEGS